mmetsp:Transcript_67514/g.93913  ORF Transcript_67514/g.93913 Transcript_67514/m.93913 type:complete len:249 (-) Transcript_67514:301-1047(-)
MRQTVCGLMYRAGPGPPRWSTVGKSHRLPSPRSDLSDTEGSIVSLDTVSSRRGTDFVRARPNGRGDFPALDGSECRLSSAARIGDPCRYVIRGDAHLTSLGKLRVRLGDPSSDPVDATLRIFTSDEKADCRLLRLGEVGCTSARVFTRVSRIWKSGDGERDRRSRSSKENFSVLQSSNTIACGDRANAEALFHIEVPKLWARGDGRRIGAFPPLAVRNPHAGFCRLMNIADGDRTPSGIPLSSYFWNH